MTWFRLSKKQIPDNFEVFNKFSVPRILNQGKNFYHCRSKTKIMMHRYFVLCTILLFISIDLCAQKNIYTTKKCDSLPLRIDGIIDEIIWDCVNWAGNFTQQEPYAEQPASEDTRFKILYDENHIYIAIRSFDSSPDSIELRMSRRDGNEGDMVGIVFDSYHDLRTGFAFIVSASGVKTDEIQIDGKMTDRSWNPIWYTKTNIDDKGWTAEIKIPLTQLRFGKQEEYIWGLQVGRYIFRKQELSLWQFVAPTAAANVAYFGELHGIRNINPKKQRDIIPYLAGGYESYQRDPDNPYADGSNWFGNIGLDGKWGLTNDFTLDFTINPDFGQVEADPSEVNLTTFETKFDERRPFFIEGKNILDFRLTEGGGPLSTDNLFYSRRIGKSPSYYPDLGDNEYEERPQNTTILGAFKITGKTKKGWSLGIMESITQKEISEIDNEGDRRKVEVEPLTNYMAARVQKEMNNSNTRIGAMLTATNRNLTEPHLQEVMHKSAYTGGIDFNHEWKNKTYYLNFNSAFSRVSGTKEAIYETQTSAPHFFQRTDAKHLSVDSARTYLDGFGGNIQQGKAGNGKWLYTFWVTWRSPGFNTNDIGYMRRNDEIQQIFWVGFRQREPFSIFRNFNANANQWYALTFGLEKRYFGGNFNAHWTFINYWSMGGGISRDSKSLSTETLRGGPALLSDGAWNPWIFIATDERKKVRMELSYENFRRDHRTAYNHNVEFQIGWQISDALNVSLMPGFSKRYEESEYISLPDSIDENIYIRGKINQSTTYLTLRLNYNITPDFTIQFYAMPFISAGKYSEFKRITDPKAEEFYDRFIQYADEQVFYDREYEIYNIDENMDGRFDIRFDQPNYNAFDFNSNLVIRWEYRPGSIVYLVWSQNRSESFNNGNFNLREDIKTLFLETYPRDVFLVKFSYRFGL